MSETPINADDIEMLGYQMPTLLPTGEWAAIGKFMWTGGLIVGITHFDYRTRFCYPSIADAAIALCQWNGIGDPPGDWIKEKGNRETGERNNPATFKGIPILTDAAR